jgi:DNA-binding LytR/AlgR family response regulator
LIKCIIVEDEVLAQEVIQRHMQRIDNLELVGVYRTAPEAVNILQSGNVDLMFLDIRLPGMTGLHFLQSLLSPPLVILTTAYAEYAVESYELNVMDYLLKPISFERFSKAVQKIADGRLFTQVSKEDALPAAEHIFIRSNSKFFKVNFAEIIYIEGMKDYLKIHTPAYTLITHQTMNDIEKQLPVRKFMRVHKSYIISFEHIKSIYGNTVELGKASIPIGISYKENIMSIVSGKAR